MEEEERGEEGEERGEEGEEGKEGEDGGVGVCVPEVEVEQVTRFAGGGVAGVRGLLFLPLLVNTPAVPLPLCFGDVPCMYSSTIGEGVHTF